MPRPLTFREIEAFRAVMLTGTTTGAAVMLHTTQPSVSRLLGQMQAAADLKLFDVQKGRLRPTPEAWRLLETVQHHFHGLERIEQDLAALRKAGTGVLRLGCTPSLGLGVMPALVSRFTRAYADIPVNLQTLGSHQLAEGLMQGRFDLVLATGSLEQGQFDIRSVHRTQAVCVMEPSHPLATRDKLHARDLDGQRLITLNAEDELSLHLRSRLGESGAQPSATVETTYSSTICSLAAEGAGIGIVNVYAASAFRHALRVIPLLPACPVEVRMALPRDIGSSRSAEHFKALVAQYFASREMSDAPHADQS